MNEAQLTALEWAIREFEGAALEGADLGRLQDLRSLYFEAVAAPYEFDTSRSDLIAFMRKHRITIPHAEFDSWRIVLPQDQLLGAIAGLPESYGRLRATNGILCYIERGENAPYLGHLQHFEPDAEANRSVRITHKGTPRKDNDNALDDFIAALGSRLGL
jgi:hypothetical protein